MLKIKRSRQKIRSISSETGPLLCCCEWVRFMRICAVLGASSSCWFILFNLIQGLGRQPRKTCVFLGSFFLGEGLDLLVYLFLDPDEIMIKSINRDVV
jgi:hypothetical protein